VTSFAALLGTDLTQLAEAKRQAISTDGDWFDCTDDVWEASHEVERRLLMTAILGRQLSPGDTIGLVERRYKMGKLTDAGTGIVGDPFGAVVAVGTVSDVRRPEREAADGTWVTLNRYRTEFSVAALPEPLTEIQCPKCGGDGYVDDDPMACPTCSIEGFKYIGLGSIPVPAVEPGRMLVYINNTWTEVGK